MFVGPIGCFANTAGWGRKGTIAGRRIVLIKDILKTILVNGKGSFALTRIGYKRIVP